MILIKNIYLIQAGELFEEGNRKGAYFPYSVGAIAAYAWDDEAIKSEYSLENFIFYRQNMREVIDSLNRPFLVGFSNFIWNDVYNRTLAKKIKEAFPECFILFGGHQIPDDGSLLNECSYIDFLIHGEGEIAFKALLLTLANDRGLSDVPGLSYRDNNGGTISNPRQRINALDFPSPYLTGMFDSLIADKSFRFIALVETNRGCPYGCAYCDSIREPLHTLRLFPLQRVFEELEWIARHGIEYCLCVDSNFGICQRDEQIVDYVVDIRKKTGYPSIFNSAFTKEKDNSVFRMVKKLKSAGLLKEFTLSFQSLSDEVLKNIGRKNMSIESFSELMGQYNKADIFPYTELILGLPGETYDSFKEGFEKLIEAGQIFYVEVFRCDVLMNSPMANKNYIKKHGIKTVMTPANLHHYKPDIHHEIAGYSRIVIATDTMKEDMWIRANLFAMFIQSMFYMGPLRFVSMYLFKEKQIKYIRFFEDLMEWSQTRTETVCGKIYKQFEEIYHTFSQEGAAPVYYNPVFGEVTWFAEEGAFLETVYNFDVFYKEMELFLEPYKIEQSILKDLLIFQKNMVNTPGKRHIAFDLEYDLIDYFALTNANEHRPPKKANNSIRFKNNLRYDNWSDYARFAVWYGRKIGRPYFSDRNSEILVEYPAD